ncbi:MAG: HesA/MoeB/ThiF family protein [Pyrinomonadaceae bacterium]
MKYSLRATESQHHQLKNHLFPGDGMEAVALLLCGRRNGLERHVLTVRQIVLIPHNECDRRDDRITWPTSFVDRLIEEAFGQGLAIVKVHSHTADYRRFSSVDDESDRTLFSAASSLLDDELPHASVVMLPGGELFGRVIGCNGEIIAPLSSIIVVGHDLQIWSACNSKVSTATEAFTLRHAQAFGVGTTQVLRHLSIAVVGCSGTGSIVVEQLARLGVGRLLLVDPDCVEEKNLNRIVNSGKKDAYLSRPKVHVLAEAIANMGLGQEVVPIHGNLIDAQSIKQVAECDIVFGCMDGAEGRHWVNRIASFYTMPYFDVGVRLDADGFGGIDQITGAAHYIQPGLSSLLSRGVYGMDRVASEEMLRTNPAMYERNVKNGYLRGVDEDRPAVISVNMLLAALTVNDFLARLHPYRNQPNSEYAYTAVNLGEMQFYPESEGEPCHVLAKHVGKGDTTPLLERPALC